MMQDVRQCQNEPRFWPHRLGGTFHLYHGGGASIFHFITRGGVGIFHFITRVGQVFSILSQGMGQVFNLTVGPFIELHIQGRHC